MTASEGTRLVVPGTWFASRPTRDKTATVATAATECELATRLLGYSAPWLLRGYSVAAPRLLLGWRLLRGYSVATPCLLRSCRSGNCRSYSVATPLLRLLTDLLTYSVATPWRLRAYSVATQLLG